MRQAVALAATLAFAAACGGDDDGDDDDDVSDASSGDAAGGADAAAGDDAAPAITDLDRLEALVAELPGLDAGAREARVMAFFTEVAYGERGFPIRDEGVLAVAVWDEGGGALSVAGDFNAWDPAAAPLAQPVPDVPFYFRIEPGVATSGRSRYKIVRDQSEWMPDPWARRLAWDENGEHSLIDAGAAESWIERWPSFAEGAGTLAARHITVYLPAGHDGTDPLPVLYLHDGQNVFAPDTIWGGWHAREAADAAAQPLLLVAIDNTPARMDEYTHVADGATGGRGGEYADFVALGVKPFIDARYATRTERAATGVAGSSLGGLISIYLAIRHPDVFGFAGSMSGSFFWGDPTMAEVVAADPPLGTDVYLDSGGGPGAGCPDGSSDNYCSTVDMADTLRALGWQDGVDLEYTWAPGAEHNEAAWAARLPGILDAFLAPGG